MQQIADWLEKLGMSEYTQRFAENDIDFAVLREELARHTLRRKPLAGSTTTRSNFQ